MSDGDPSPSPQDSYDNDLNGVDPVSVVSQLQNRIKLQNIPINLAKTRVQEEEEEKTETGFEIQ